MHLGFGQSCPLNSFLLLFLPSVCVFSTTSGVIVTTSTYILKEKKEGYNECKSICSDGEQQPYNSFCPVYRQDMGNPNPLCECIRDFTTKFFRDHSISAPRPRHMKNTHYHPDSNTSCLKVICWTQILQHYFYLTNNTSSHSYYM